MTTATIATATATAAKPQAGMRLSAIQFMDLPDADNRRKMELDDGALYIMPRPRPEHQFAQGELLRHFVDYRDRFAASPIEVYHDIILSLFPERPRLLLSPDLIVIRRGGLAIVTSTMVVGVPDIIIEILSTDRTRDLVRKRSLYAAAGVPEYWQFDLRPDTVAQLELRNGAYTQRALLTADDTLATPLLPGLAIPLSAIFRHRRRPPRSD